MASKESKIDSESLDLLVQLFNARQRRLYHEDELDNAKEALKLAKGEEESVMLLISGAVPRLREAAPAVTKEDIPELLDWVPAEHVNAEKAAAAVPEEDTKLDELEFDHNGHLKIDRFVVRPVKNDREGFWDAEVLCADCSSVMAKLRIPDAELPPAPEPDQVEATATRIKRLRAIVGYMREPVQVHNTLYHGAGEFKPL